MRARMQTSLTSFVASNRLFQSVKRAKILNGSVWTNVCTVTFFQPVENSIVTVDSGIVWTSIMLRKGRVLALTQTIINFPWISFIRYLTVLLHPVTRTLANFNQNQFPLDFRHTFTGNFTLAGADLGGGCRGCAPSPEMTYGFLIQLVFCRKKKLCGLLVLK